MNAVFYGFQFPHHGQFSAFSALSSALADQGVVVRKFPLLNIPSYIPGRICGMMTSGWFRAQETRLKSAFSRGDLVHYFFPENSLFQAPKWKKNGSLVLSCHQPIEQLAELRRQGALPHFFKGLEAADAVVLMASCELDAYRELAPNAEVLCIPHGVDTDFFCPGAAREEGRQFRILTVGNWLRDYDLWAQVVGRVSVTSPDVEFSVLANPDQLAAALANLKSGRGKVRVLQGISDEQLRDEYRHADLIFIPLTNAWANNALLEGMSCGRPVVATDLPAIREYAGDAVRFIEKGEVDAAVDAIIELRRAGDERELMGRQARIRMENQFSWRHIAKQYLHLYAELAVCCAGEIRSAQTDLNKGESRCP